MLRGAARDATTNSSWGAKRQLVGERWRGVNILGSPATGARRPNPLSMVVQEPAEAAEVWWVQEDTRRRARRGVFHGAKGGRWGDNGPNGSQARRSISVDGHLLFSELADGSAA